MAAHARWALRQSPGWFVRAGMLLCALVVGKLGAFWLRALDGDRAALGSMRWLPVLLQDELAFVLCVGLLDWSVSRFSRRAEGTRFVLSWLVGIYAAINVPVQRMFGTPLTFSILRATDVALLDSLRVYVTGRHVLAMGAVLGAMALGRWLFGRMSPGRGRTVIGMGVLCLGVVLLGRSQRGSVPLGGLSRGVVATIVQTTWLHRTPVGAAREIQVPPLPPLDAPQRQTDLSALRGAAQNLDVLWIVLESTAAQYLHPYGAPEDPMPTLTALSSRGVLFEAAYAAYPESIKGLFATLCSLSPASHTTAAAYTQHRLPCRSIAQRLAETRVHTALVHAGWFAYLGMQGIVQDRGFSHLWDAEQIGGRYATSFGVDEPATVAQVLAFFDQVPPGARAFAMYLPITGHHPYHAPGPPTRPQPFGTAREIDHYRNDLFLGDKALAQLIDGLAQRGRLNRTAVVVSGDHGEAFFQHPGNFGHTLALHEENLHVPLLLVVPGKTDTPTFSPRRVPDPVSLLDVAPTLADLVGLPVEPPVDAYAGQSLLRPRSTDHVPRALIEHTLLQLALRQGPWKFIDEPETNRGQLYDLSADPSETRNLVEQHPARVAAYRAHLRAWAARQRLLLAHGLGLRAAPGP